MLRPAPSLAELIPSVSPRGLGIAMWLLLPPWMLWVAMSLMADDTRAAAWTLENGFLQFLTVVCYVLGGVLVARLTWLQFRTAVSPSPRRWWLLVLTVGCLMVAGEETNWGQTYLNFETPELIRQSNLQQQFSIHNLRLPGDISGTYVSNEILWWLAILGGGILPLVLLMSPRMRGWAWAGELPLPPWQVQAYCLTAAAIPRDDDMLGKLTRANIPSELREVTIAMAVALWMWTLWRHRRTVIKPAPSPL